MEWILEDKEKRRLIGSHIGGGGVIGGTVPGLLLFHGMEQGHQYMEDNQISMCGFRWCINGNGISNQTREESGNTRNFFYLKCNLSNNNAKEKNKSHESFSPPISHTDQINFVNNYGILGL